MPKLYTYELELEASEYPEILSQDQLLVIKYSYHGGHPAWFNPSQGIGDPGEPSSVEIYSSKVRPSSNPKAPLLDFEETYPEIAEPMLYSDDLYDLILEAHEDAPGDI